jgi:phosphoglycerol transferase MdoB-like AlkP superfamily enzyme
MPGMDGFDFLDHCMPCKHIPFPLIYILTISLFARGVVKADSYKRYYLNLYPKFAFILEQHFPELIYNKVIEQKVEQSTALTVDN